MSAEAWQRPLKTLEELKAACVELQKRLVECERPGSASVVAALFSQLCALHEREKWKHQADAIRFVAENPEIDFSIGALHEFADHVQRYGLELP